MELLCSTPKYRHVCLNTEMFWFTWHLGKIKVHHVYAVTLSLSACSVYTWGYVPLNLGCTGLPELQVSYQLWKPKTFLKIKLDNSLALKQSMSLCKVVVVVVVFLFFFSP